MDDSTDTEPFRQLAQIRHTMVVNESHYHHIDMVGVHSPGASGKMFMAQKTLICSHV